MESWKTSEKWTQKTKRTLQALLLQSWTSAAMNDHELDGLVYERGQQKNINYYNNFKRDDMYSIVFVNSLLKGAVH